MKILFSLIMLDSIQNLAATSWDDCRLRCLTEALEKILMWKLTLMQTFPTFAFISHTYWRHVYYIPVYGVLTKRKVKLIGQVLIFFTCLCTSTPPLFINMIKEEEGKYLAILNKQTWPIKDLLWLRGKLFFLWDSTKSLMVTCGASM